MNCAINLSDIWIYVESNFDWQVCKNSFEPEWSGWWERIHLWCIWETVNQVELITICDNMKDQKWRS